ncbi:MAG TPA: response regulator [Bacteriovoracaceae bacterium]|nr:response regulator [Bacteriovoracaceae bacterium]
MNEIKNSDSDRPSSASGEKDKSLKIMVIDDSDLSRRSIIESLESGGYKVVGEANSAAQSMQIIGSVPCNLFIIDVVMPEVSGIDLAKKLTELLRDAYIILMSSLHSENIVIDSISAGAVDFLPKPFSKDQLLQAVAKVEALILEK